ncbi:MAG: putative phage abortive infection protein [Novosphingobium sp.]
MNDDASERLFAKIPKRRAKPPLVAYLICGWFIVALMWLFWAVSSDWWAMWSGSVPFEAVDLEKRSAAVGQWGDAFGGFNALFGALGFSAVVVTFWVQFKALEIQQRDQHLQRFEASFFELIRLLRELRAQLRYKQTDAMQLAASEKYTSDKSRSEYAAIKYAFYEVRHWLMENNVQCQKYQRSDIEKIYDNCVHNRYEARFAPYFRMVYTILNKILCDQVLEDGEKIYYANIVRAHLTSYDIQLIAFNATSAVANDLFDYLTYFRMLKYVPKGRGLTILKDVYPPKAFAARD